MTGSRVFDAGPALAAAIMDGDFAQLSRRKDF